MTLRIRYLGGVVWTPDRPGATSLVTEDDRIAWLGTDEQDPGPVDAMVNLDGAVVLPAFVDAHVHATSTGLVLRGLDLSTVRSATELLIAVEHHIRMQPEGVILGHGWDETTWQSRTLPTQAELDAACRGRAAYLSRIDVHSALASSALLALAPQASGAPGDEAPVVARQAHHHVREAALASVTPVQRRAAQRAFLVHARSQGIASVHEMAGPVISGEDDLRDLMAAPGMIVVGYWGELVHDGGVERAAALGARGAAGDLFVDGALGSHTACLTHEYADSQGFGAAYLDADAIADHVTAATRAGLQAGFHVIGDAACQMVMAGMQRAHASLGGDAFSRARHRLEHAEMLSDGALQAMSAWGVTASMQSVFDELWGGPGGMYEQRLGVQRAAGMNRWGSLVSRGGSVALGSDSPVTPVGPWRAMRAAMRHHQPAERLTAAQAMHAHTVAGWRAGGVDDAGLLVTGAPAHFAVWSGSDIDAPAWANGQPTIPEDDPQAILTVIDGAAYRAGSP